MLFLAAIIPTLVTIFALLRLISRTKNFDRKYGEISDLNIHADTRFTLFVIFIFWETCQSAFLMLTHSMLARQDAVPVILLMVSLVAGLVGLLFRSRTAAHQFFICLSIGLSFIVMMMESILAAEFVVIAIMIMTSLYLLRTIITRVTPNYWKLEIVILVLYAVWNTVSAFALR